MLMITYNDILMVRHVVLSDFMVYWSRFCLSLGTVDGLSAPQDLNFWDWWNLAKITKKSRFFPYRFLISFENHSKMAKIDAKGAQTHSEHHFLPLEGHRRWFWAFLGNSEIFDFVASGKWPKMAKKLPKMLIFTIFCNLKLEDLGLYLRQKYFE